MRSSAMGLPRHYDSYTFTNTTGATQCVTMDTNTACTGTNFIFIGAYLGSFDPNNICTNWIGDSGSARIRIQPFQVNVDNGQTFVVVVSEVTPDAGCPGYTVTITPGRSAAAAARRPRRQRSPTCTAGGTPGRGRQACHIRQPMCVMVLPRLPRTSMCLVVYLTARGERGQSHGSGHRDVGIARADALYQ